MAENLHSQHRQRVRKEFLDRGIDENTPAHKIFELLLFYSVPRCDTNVIAHRLLDKFGSISAVLDAPIDQLTEVEGIGESSALLIKTILPLARIYKNEKAETPVCFRSIDEIGDMLINKYFGLTEEVLSIVCLDGNARFLSYNVIQKGDVDTVGVPIRTVVKIVSSTNAQCVVLAHNHPSGVAIPSRSDIKVTEMVAEALSHIGIKLIDHIIIADDDYISLSQSEKYKYIFS